MFVFNQLFDAWMQWKWVWTSVGSILYFSTLPLSILWDVCWISSILNPLPSRHLLKPQGSAHSALQAKNGTEIVLAVIWTKTRVRPPVFVPFCSSSTLVFVPKHGNNWRSGLWKHGLPAALCVHTRGEKHELIAFFTERLKWRRLNEVRQLGSLRIATAPNCDLKYARNPLIWQQRRFQGRH